MQHFKIDINCDMGEGMGNEAYIMPFISSANIACGGHTGNADSIKRMLRLVHTPVIMIKKTLVEFLNLFRYLN